MRGTSAFRHLLFLLLLVALSSAAYSNSFQVPFVFDDFVNIIDKKSIRMFTPDLPGIISAAREGQSGSRWLPNLTLALNYYLGGENVWGYHLVNLAIHLGCALVFYLLCLTTLRLPAVARTIGDRGVEIASAATLLWALHPLQTNAVTYLVQRMTSLCALFYLAALLCYARARLHRSSAGRRSALYAACLLFGLMAVTSKQNALMLPLMLLGYDCFFLQEGQWTRKKYNTILVWALAGLALILLLTIGFLGMDIFSSILEGYRYRNFTLPERLLTEARVIFLYLALLVLPLPSRLNLNHDLALSHGLLSPPQTVFAVAGIGILIVLIFFLFNRNRLLSFALFWFLGNLVIESTVVPLELVFEHRLYLPSTFLFLSGTSLLFSLGGSRPWPARIVCLLLACLLTFWTWQRNQVWASEITLWSDVVAKSPGLARGYNNLGVAYHEAKDVKTAEDLFKKAIRMEPESRTAYISLGALYVTQNRLAEAEQVLRAALTKQPLLTPARIYHFLGVMYQKGGNYPAAIDYSRRALHLDKGDPEPLINLGIVYEKLGDYPKADATFAEALSSGLNDSVDLYNNWGITVFKMGRTDKAIEYFRQGLRIEPDHAESHYNMGLAYSQKGMTREALAEMQLSMRLRQQQP